MVAKYITSKLSLTDTEKRTFALHGWHMLLEGIIDGALILNEFILIKSLFGTNYQISFLFQFSIIVLLLSVVFNELLKRAKNVKRFLIVVALLTRLPLAGLIFFPTNASEIAANPIFASVFLSTFLLYYLYKPTILPAINLLLRANYETQNFGKLYSYSTSIKSSAMLGVAFGFGLLLDHDNYAFTYIYPVLSVLGIVSIYILSKIEYHKDAALQKFNSLYDSVRELFLRMVDILLKNKPYRDFEIGFMVYGFAWMSTAAVITIFMDKALELDYFSISFYKNSYTLMAILLLPTFGKLIGKIDPRKFGVLSFSTMALHLLFLVVTYYYPSNFQLLGIKFYPFLIISYGFYGFFSATMPLLWGIGSSYFCSTNNAGDYQSAHLMLVGFRGLFAPLIGVYFYELTGFVGTFMLGVFMLIIAMAIMVMSQRKYGL